MSRPLFVRNTSHRHIHEYFCCRIYLILIKSANGSRLHSKLHQPTRTTTIFDERYDRAVSNLPHPPSVSPTPPPWQPLGPTARNRPAWWPAFVPLVIAVAAVGIAIGAWFRPPPENKPTPPPSAPTYKNQQIAAAKTDVCAAYQHVRRALDVAGARNGGSDAASSLAVATASRQALDVGSRYLLTKLADEPATTPDLATAVRKLAAIYQEITVSYLADASDAEINPLRQAADQPTATIDGLCN